MSPGRENQKCVERSNLPETDEGVRWVPGQQQGIGGERRGQREAGRRPLEKSDQEPQETHGPTDSVYCGRHVDSGYGQEDGGGQTDGACPAREWTESEGSKEEKEENAREPVTQD